MVADVDGDDRVRRQVLGERGEDRRRGDALPRSSRDPASLLGTPERPPGGDVRSLVDGLGRPACASSSAGSARAASARIGTATAWNRPIDAGSSSIWMIGLYDAMPVWLENDAPTTISRSDSFISQLATGVPLRPSTPAPSGWVSGTSPLALKVVSTGAPSRSASATSSALAGPGTVADDEDRALRVAHAAAAAARCLRRRGRSRRSANRPSGAGGARSDGSSWTSSGSTRCATPRPSTACLTARAASSAWSLPACDGRGRDGDVAEHRGQVEVLERASAEHLRRHLPGDRDHRRLVELRVVQAGQQVRRSRPGDREAGCRPTGELAVGTRRERRRALVPDPDEAELAPLLGPAQRVGEAEVRVADHAEDGVDAMGDQGLDQHVGDGARAWQSPWQLHVDAVVALLHVVRRDRVAEALRRLPGERVVVVAVPRAAQPAVLDRTLADRAALVRAPVLQRPEPPAASGQRHGPAVDDGAVHPALVGDVLGRELVPGLGHGPSLLSAPGSGKAQQARFLTA